MAKRREQGLSINDIGPAYKWVTIGEDEAEDGTKTPRRVKVHGIGAKYLFALDARFPVLSKWFRGTKSNFEELLKEAPDAVAAIIAIALGFPEDAEAEEEVSMYGIETQLDCLEKIGGLTFKNGFGPFVQRIVLLAQQVASAPNSGRAPSTTSPTVSVDSLTVDITAPGTTPPDK